MLHAVPDALRQKTQMAEGFERRLREREAAVQRSGEERVTAVRAAAAKDMAAAEERVSAAERRNEAELREAQHAARVARDDAVALVRDRKKIESASSLSSTA